MRYNSGLKAGTRARGRGRGKPSPFAGWVELSGFPKFTTTLLPFLLGAVLAWSEANGHQINLPVLVCSLVAVFLLTDFCFVLNACSVYTDVIEVRGKSKSKSRVEVSGGTRTGAVSTLHSTAVSGRFNALESGHITVNQAVKAAYICLLAAIPLSMLLWLVLDTGILTIPLGLFGIIVAYSYSRGPRLSYNSLGELALTAGVGWLTVFSGYYLQAGHVSWLPTVVALPWMIEVFKLKLTRELPDFECDAEIGRRTLAIRLGKYRTVALYLPLTVCAWALFIPLLWLNIPYYGLPLLTLVLPAFYTGRSVMAALRLQRHSGGGGGGGAVMEGEEQELEVLVRSGFNGMILIPVALICIFGLKVLL